MMDSSQLDHAGRSSPEALSDSSLSPSSPETSGILGDPVVHPRVGDEYQVDIPDLLSASELMQLMKNPNHCEGIVNPSPSFSLGLPIPVMFICNQANIIKSERVESSNETQFVRTNGLVASETVATTQISVDNKNVKINAPNQTSVGNLSCLVPGQPTEPWSAFEADCFLLGLYMFGKNLLQVQRFMESKGMGQVLSYYYGQFYGSAGYKRWSECRKMRSKKCVVGHRFFSGYRMQGLFSRLFPSLSEESKTKLLERAKAFAEGGTSLDDLIFTLKALVGIRALVDAVGIGKGKQDLTTLFLEGARGNQSFANRPEVPSGKACSALSCAEIVKYLTGDFRLSKARSNDLFWEAVWPRLLARGWHSEQPMGDGYIGSKHCLVFLVPGIKKFSRRKLSKGDHYFDSVSDVLAKVASEPELIELEADETNPSCSKEENGWATMVKSDDDQDSSDHERHCYLKPRVSLGLSDLTNFTVIDTSLANEDNPYKVRELRNLPVEVNSCSTRSSPLMNSETAMEVEADSNGLQNSSFSAQSKGLPSDNDGSQRLVFSTNAADTDVSMGHKSRTIKHQFSRRTKPILSGCSGAVAKRRKLTSCLDADVTCVLSLPAKNRSTTLKIVGPFKVRPTNVNVTSENSLAAGTANEKVVQDSFNRNCLSSDVTPDDEKLSAAQKPIDLNLSQEPTEPQSDGKVKLEEEVSISNQFPDADKSEHFDADKQQHYEDQKESHIVAEVPETSQAENSKQYGAEVQKCSDDTIGHSDIVEPQVSSAVNVPVRPNNNRKSELQPRRQSTRNRPLTTKALEALEIGFSNPVWDSKKRSSSTTQDQKLKRSRQMRNSSSISPHETALETSNGRTDMVGHCVVPTLNEKHPHEMLGLSKVSFPPASS